MQRQVKVLEEGIAEYFKVDPDAFRDWVSKKSRAMEPKLMDEHEAISRFVQDGDYIVWECNYLQRGPSALIRELIRQKRENLWLAGKFTWVTAALLVEAGCATQADMGFFFSGPGMNRAILEDRFKVYEYSNVVMTARLRAGAMGVPFIVVRSLAGTDGFKYSGAKIIEDPYTGRPTIIVPALNPNVALIHAQQADIYGNARIFGPGISDAESALASRRVIISTEEIVDTEDIRRSPKSTTIPFYVTDALVHAPFGAYPGECGGYYASDTDHVMEVFSALYTDRIGEYLEKWVYSVSSHEEMLEKQVGTAKLLELTRRAIIKEGWKA
ncbi:MAG: CoA transferase subunit A [Dehalococcoidia bacterium]